VPQYVWQFGIVTRYLDVLLLGCLETIKLTVLCYALSNAAGLILGLLSMTRLRPVRALVIAWIEIFRGIPGLVVLLWVYLALPQITGFSLSSFASAVVALSVTLSAYLAEVYRAGIQSIDRGQAEAGFAVGMRWAQVMRRIVLPQAIRRVVPPLTNALVSAFQLTALASIVNVHDLIFEAQTVSITTFRPLELYTVTAILYLAMLYPLTLAARLGEARYAAVVGEKW
jgi:polar amino acid transport system permease protein